LCKDAFLVKDYSVDVSEFLPDVKDRLQMRPQNENEAEKMPINEQENSDTRYNAYL